MIAAFSIAPAGPDDRGSYAAAVAEAVRIVRASGLPHETNAMFTNIEGEWDEVMAVLKQCVDAMTASHPRVSLVVKTDIRPGHAGQLAAKVVRIDELLGEA
ncbi:MAG: MTH1187 family thiamine-binding protein [Ornithinibacter sp.]